MSVRQEIANKPRDTSTAVQIENMADEYQSIFDEQIELFQTESAKVKENFESQLKKIKTELSQTKEKLAKKEAVEIVAEKQVNELGKYHNGSQFKSGTVSYHNGPEKNFTPRSKNVE